jgi:hypothetical protein
VYSVIDDNTPALFVQSFPTPGFEVQVTIRDPLGAFWNPGRQTTSGRWRPIGTLYTIDVEHGTAVYRHGNDGSAQGPHPCRRVRIIRRVRAPDGNLLIGRSEGRFRSLSSHRDRAQLERVARSFSKIALRPSSAAHAIRAVQRAVA